MANINEWLSIDKTSGTGNAYVTLTASSSTELQERIASLSIKTRSKEVFLNVKQLAFNNYFVLGKDLISPIWEGGSYSNYVLSNISWTYTSSDWISLSVTSGSVGRTEFNVVAQPNTSEDTRIGFVNIVSSNGVIMGTIKVAQASHNEVNNVIFYTSTDGNKITPYSSTGVVANEYVDGVGALYYADAITEVPQNLFRNKDTLASVSVPETVTTIKSGAFYDCDKLASYDFPDTLTTIEADAFRSCDSLAIFDFPSVETIGDNAFNGCSLETVILSDTLHTTGKSVFHSCTKLKTIHIGSGLTSISENLCYGCTSLEAIDIPIAIKRIEQGAFYNCTAIETLYLHGGIEYIGYMAFYGNKIKSVTLGERTSALEYGTNPFSPSTAYMTDAYVTDIKSWFLWQPQLFTNNNVVRNLYVNGELLTEVITPTDYDIVPEYAFYNNPHITSVIVTDNVTSVGSYAFNGLNNANYLYLGSGASYDNNYQRKSFSDFDGTLELKNTDGSLLEYNYFTKVVFMSDTTTVSSSHSTQEVEFRGDVLSVGTNTVNVFRNVTRVVVNCNQLHIGNNLFCGATLLTEFDFSKVVYIGGSSFENTSITELSNAPLLTSIGGSSVMGESFKNVKLKTVNLSNSPLSSIGDSAFLNCTELTEVILPSLSYTIGSYVFQGCSNLKHIKMVSEGNEPTVPTISNYTFNGIAEYGFLEYPLDLDYTPWLSTNSYYLGYYKWNRFNLSATELDFDAADTYEVTVENGVPYTWEITQLPFWLTASVMSGGEGTTTITFTKTTDYVESDDIIFSITGVNYVIKAKYTVRTLDFTEQDTYVLNISNTTSITDVSWLTETFDSETVTLTLGTLYTVDSQIITIKTPIGDFKVNAIADGSNTPLPKADNRIYYTGWVISGESIIYGTNAEYVGGGYYGGGLRYLEYDRPITRIDGVFAEGSGIERLSLPSTLLYLTFTNVINDEINGEYILGGQAFHTDTLQEVDFGGNELYIGNYSFFSSKLQKFNLPKTVRVIGRCSFGGKTETQDFGTDTLNIGADMKLIAAGAFSGMGKINRINFYGMIPPTFEVWFNVNHYVYPFANINPSCEVHIPIGADYSSLYTDGGLPSTCTIIADLTAEEPTTYETSMWLDGGHTRINPNHSCFVYFYNAETNEYSSTNPFNTYHNTTTEIISEIVTINNIPLVIEVRADELNNVSWSQRGGSEFQKIMCIKGNNIYRTEFICSLDDVYLSREGFAYKRDKSYDELYGGSCWVIYKTNYNSSWVDIQNVTISARAYDKYNNYIETSTIKIRELF